MWIRIMFNGFLWKPYILGHKNIFSYIAQVLPYTIIYIYYLCIVFAFLYSKLLITQYYLFYCFWSIKYLCLTNRLPLHNQLYKMILFYYFSNTFDQDFPKPIIIPGRKFVEVYKYGPNVCFLWNIKPISAQIFHWYSTYNYFTDIA